MNGWGGKRKAKNLFKRVCLLNCQPRCVQRIIQRVWLHHILPKDMPLSQYRMAQFLAVRRSDYNAAACAAPAAEPDAPLGVTSVLDNMPNPFPAPLVVVDTPVKLEPCSKCYQPLASRGTNRPVQCDMCHEFWHLMQHSLSIWTVLNAELTCASLQMPPRHGSWACPRCLG